MKLKDALCVKDIQLDYETIKYLISQFLRKKWMKQGYDVKKFNFVSCIYQHFYIIWFLMSSLIVMLCILKHCILFSHCHEGTNLPDLSRLYRIVWTFDIF